MLLRYSQVKDHTVPDTARRFAQAAEHMTVPEGFIIPHEAFLDFLKTTRVGEEVKTLQEAVSDEGSRQRVKEEIKRRVVTGKLPESISKMLTQISEHIGIFKQDGHVAQIPLVLVLYTQEDISGSVMINVIGTKGLADAIRALWSRVCMEDGFTEEDSTAIAVFRMPPVTACAVAGLSNEKITLEASLGWGQFVEHPSEHDTYVVNTNAMLIENKDIKTQDMMIERNQQTGAVQNKAAANGAEQKVSDEQIRLLAADAKELGELEAVFGVTNEKHWLLRIPHTSAPAVIVEKADEVKVTTGEDVPEDGEGEEEQVPEPVEEVEVHAEQVDESEIPEDGEGDEEDEPEEESEEDEVEEDEPEEEEPEEESDDEEGEEDDEDLEDDEEYEDEDGEEEEDDEEYEDDEEDVEEDDEDVEEDDEEYEDDEDEDDEEYEDDEEGDEEDLEDDEEYEDDEEGDEEEDDEEYEDEDDEVEEDDEEEPEEESDDEEVEIEYDNKEDDEPEEEEKELPEFEEFEKDDTPPQADESSKRAKVHASEVLENALKTIEHTLREWLRDEPKPDDFLKLVEAVAKKRQIPYKQRVIGLYEMKGSGAFENPSPETVKFAMDTMDRFTKEF